MAVYRFKVSFEDYDDVTREIDIKPTQTFEDLHRAIQQSTGYNAEAPSSFYVSNDQWTKGEEITFMPNQKRIDRGITLMEKVKLSSFIDDPHQKFYYTYNFDRPYDFHVELMKIIMDENKDTVYPTIVKSTGEAPKMFVNNFSAAAVEDEGEDFDFLNEVDFEPEDVEEFSEVDESAPGSSRAASRSSHDEDHEEEHDEEDDVMDEFSDNDNYDDDDRGGRHGSRGDDY